MNNKTKNTQLLADYLTKNLPKDEIIPEIFRLFSVDCLQRCSLDPSCMDALIKRFQEGEESNPSALAEIIDFIQTNQKDTRNKENEMVKAIVSCLDRDFDKDMSIEQIAENLHISYYYMCHIFKDKYNVSVNTYRTAKRLGLAMKLLVESDRKIADISASCGYNNLSYFTEVFTKFVGASPVSFRDQNKDKFFHDFYGYEDFLLASKIDCIRFLSDSVETLKQEIKRVDLYDPNDDFRFLHETAIVEYHGVLYASWYLCPKHELQDYTPIAGKRSRDGGKTWTETEILCSDESEKILYCPPVYGICDDRLYMLVNQMVAADHIHSLDLYILNNETDRFELLWSRPIPFKLNTNVVSLRNGKLMLCGRVGELDGFPNTPAVMISDSGKIDGEWRLVKIAESGALPDGSKLIHPEITVISTEDALFMFCRNDQRKVPLVYVSRDFGETWSRVQSHDIPYVSSKIYCGELTNGRHYMLCSTEKFNRTRLTAYFTSDSSPVFTKRLELFDTDADVWGSMHYPAACEYNGHLYVTATRGYANGDRGAELFQIDLKQLGVL